MFGYSYGLVKSSSWYMTQENKFRSKGENELFDDHWSSINAFKAKENICGLMVTSYRSYFFEREGEETWEDNTFLFVNDEILFKMR